MMNENDYIYEDPYYTPHYAPVEPGAAPANKKKKNRTGLKMVLLALICSLVGGMAGAAITGGGTPVSGGTALTESTRTPTAVEVSYVPGSTLMTAAEVYAANVNSTVGVTTSIVGTNFFGYRTSSAAAGSGFIVTSDGYIVTNFHVIEDSSSIQVSTYDGKTYDAALVGYDEADDLAVLKIDATGLTPVVFGNSDSLHVGDDVIAIGNPLGELTFSLTKGSVSALNREVTLSSDVTMNLIQTDAAINSGNSGGALFNMYGEVVGITNAKYSSSGFASEASIDNIGFAIPISDVESVIKGIIEKGYYAKPFIGVYLYDGDAGVTIQSVNENSPAEAAGVQAGDVITAANGEAMDAASELTALVSDLTPGDALTLTVSRGGETLELDLTVGEKQQSSLSTEDGQNAQSGDGYGYGDGAQDGYGFFGFPFGFSGDVNRG